ncbi:3-oxo-5-alpha-steroid 4-dehydrogenase, C-terminal [Dillenia turbinata]|uniref:3-oxo-5-alpha-steroid 4-dehydrogenase, C-terminal n=1 Tax=Dillenia turbinata TaxID=194707 RepID=A0AAN8ZTK4_9MAGN
MLVIIMEFWFVELLRMTWIAAILPILIASLPFSNLTYFYEILMAYAEGRSGNLLAIHNGAKIKFLSFSQLQKFSVPQRFFSHFYVVAVPWTTLSAVTTWYYAYKTATMLSESLLYPTVASHLTGDSCLFSMSRSHSTLFRDRYKIWRFYTAAPLSFCCNWAPDIFNFAVNQVFEFIVRGKDRMHEVEFDQLGFTMPLLKLGWLEWIGAFVFIWGRIHQHRCHAILGSLREHKEESDEYLIPYSDWFEIVSSPHYLAEIVIYAGILIATGCADLTIWLLFLFVVLLFQWQTSSSQQLRRRDGISENLKDTQANAVQLYHLYTDSGRAHEKHYERNLQIL